ncbi:hypothetical protein [Methylomonas methanica]|uniref:Uncharacterized protein n=1 Tax=Methylomonas methanica (strain DSM 25384 / MC09) TaxID=857087 RepID=G0A580_METMM|nr:hypothetical protein [Methylomonas methanica]AEG00410.1 hypothetical protein Metme_1999 [Methylomonas methanica MC09]
MNFEPETVFATNAEPDTRQNPYRTVPHWLKLAGGGLTVIVLLSLGWFGMHRLQHPQLTSMRDVENQVDDQAQRGSELTTATETQKGLPAVEATDDPNLPATADQPTPPLATVHQQTAELTQTIHLLKATVADQTSQSAAWQSQQTAILHTVQQQLTEQAGKLEQLAGLIKPNTATKDKPVKRPTSKLANKRKHRVKVTVPFNLISIDQWGDQTYAVLQHHGQWYEKTSGQTLLDWHIVSIDRDAQTLMVKNPQGQQQTVSMSANANRKHARQDEP